MPRHASPPSGPSLRVLLVDDGAHRVRHIAEALILQGHTVVGVLDEATRIHDAVQTLHPDVVIVDAESPTRDTLENLALMNERAPRPVVMFSEDDAGDAMRAALKAGVSAYVVAGLSPQRLVPVMQVAQARFEQEQALKSELAEALKGTGQRKKVDEAKRILMGSLQLSEPEVHRRLQKMAMDRGVSAATLAQRLIDAHQLLRG
jgi:two-component system, response regulator / RNA-binding antiterminator